MRRPVRIVSRPKAQSGLEIKMNPGMGFNANQLSWPVMAGEFSQKDIETRSTIEPTDWENANLEAEKGETVVTDLNRDGIPEHYKIGGERHYNGGTPLNLPPDSFIFSRDRSMKIKDEDILKMFGKSFKRGGYTPADLAKTYDINKYRKILADPDTDDLQRKTAEMMIANYNLKLGKLALAQESLKGFPQGIPAISMPYLENMGMNPAEFLQTQGQPDQPAPDNMAKYGGVQYRNGLPMAQHGFDPTTLAGWGAGLLNVLEAPQRAMMYVGTGLFGDEARYEMPSETLKRNYPDSSPILQGALDVLADPLLMAGAAKSIARVASKDIIDAAVTEAVKGSLKGASKYEMSRAILNAAGKPVTSKNVAVAIKAGEAAQKAGESGKQAYGMSKAAAKAAGKERMIQDVGKAGELAKEYGEIAAKKAAQAGKYAGEKVVQGAKYTAEKAQQAAEAIGSPYLAPVVTPLARTTGSTITAKVNQQKAEDAEKREQVLRGLLAEQAKNRYIPAKHDKYGNVLFNNPAFPGKTFTIQDNKYVPYEAPKAAAAPDTLKKLSKQQIREIMGLPPKAYGGSILPKAKKGTLIEGGKYYFETDSGERIAIDKEEYDEYLASQKKGSSSSSKSATKDTGRSAAEEVKTFEPYGSFSRNLLSQVTSKETPLREDLVSGYQTPSGEGTYGKKVSVKEWEQRVPEYHEEFKKRYGRKFNPSTDTEIFQKEFNPHLYNLTYKRALEAGYPEAEAKILAQKFVENEGFHEGTKKGDPRGMDKKFGEFTSSRFEPILEPYKKPEAPLPPPAKEEAPAPKSEAKVEHLEPQQRVPANAPWWLQDIIKVAGAAGDFARVKKHMPWQATPQVFLPEGVFYDPNRELAANAESANIMAQNLAAFSGPQALSARTSQIQGQAAKNAADVLGRYNNLNVGIANQLEGTRANTLNQAAQQRAALATNLYDKNTIANQQFENAKNMARQNLRESYIQGLTNKWNTFNLNQLFPQYNVHPEVGGGIFFEDGRPVPPVAGQDTRALKKYQEYRGLLPAGTTDQTVWNIVKTDMGQSPGNPGFDPEYLKLLQANMSEVGS